MTVFLLSIVMIFACCLTGWMIARLVTMIRDKASASDIVIWIFVILCLLYAIFNIIDVMTDNLISKI